MPSSNPRYADYRAREMMRSLVRSRIAAGEPCAICGQPIDLGMPQTYVDPKDGRRKRAPWSWEVDEIVPLARGGSPFDPDNVQPAHRICNERKGCGRARVVRVRRVAGSPTRAW